MYLDTFCYQYTLKTYIAKILTLDSSIPGFIEWVVLPTKSYIIPCLWQCVCFWLIH